MFLSIFMFHYFLDISLSAKYPAIPKLSHYFKDISLILLQLFFLNFRLVYQSSPVYGSYSTFTG